MSRSYKKTPIHGNAMAESDKPGKIMANRRHRRINKNRIKIDAEPIAMKEIADNWNFPKDGKRYHKDMSEDMYRK